MSLRKHYAGPEKRREGGKEFGGGGVWGGYRSMYPTGEGFRSKGDAETQGKCAELRA